MSVSSLDEWCSTNVLPSRRQVFTKYPPDGDVEWTGDEDNRCSNKSPRCNSDLKIGKLTFYYLISPALYPLPPGEGILRFRFIQTLVKRKKNKISK